MYYTWCRTEVRYLSYCFVIIFRALLGFPLLSTVFILFINYYYFVLFYSFYLVFYEFSQNQIYCSTLKTFFQNYFCNWNSRHLEFSLSKFLVGFLHPHFCKSPRIILISFALVCCAFSLVICFGFSVTPYLLQEKNSEGSNLWVIIHPCLSHLAHINNLI